MTESPTAIADRVALRFGSMHGVKPRLLILQALLAYESERQTGHGVDWVLAAEEPIGAALRTLVRTKPSSLAIEHGALVFQLVLDATRHERPELVDGPFLVGRVIGDVRDQDVLATLHERKEIAGRCLLIYSGELA